MSHPTCTTHQVIQWVSTEVCPPERGTYLCAVDTGDGCELHTLEWDGGRHWLINGESTFFLDYQLTPYAWAKAIEAPPRDLFPE